MKKEFSDQLQRMVSVDYPPDKIVSLVPSLTELLFDLGLKGRICGITRYCTRTSGVETDRIIRVGGTKDIDIPAIKSLSPHLVIANKEENTRESIGVLAEELPVWVSDINDLNDALYVMRTIGEMTGKAKEAADMAEKIHTRFHFPLISPQLSVAYVIWRKPYMTVGKDTFIHDMLTRCGLRNVFEHSLRYPVFTASDLEKLSPDLIFLSSEPFPFKEKHMEEFQAMVPGAKIMLVDGEYFSWYGSRLLHAPDYFKGLFRTI